MSITATKVTDELVRNEKVVRDAVYEALVPRPQRFTVKGLIAQKARLQAQIDDIDNILANITTIEPAVIEPEQEA